MAYYEYNMTSPGQQPTYVKMELYSVVLSVTSLSLAVFFGGAGNLLIILSLLVYRLMRRMRYILLTLLMVTSLIFDIVYCPMEICHLISHYHSNNVAADNTLRSLKFALPSIFLTLVTGTMCVLVLISVYNLCVLTDKFKCFYRYVLSIFCVVLALALMLGPSISYGIMSRNMEDNVQSYHVLNTESYIFRLVVYSLWISLALLVLVGMTSFILVTRQTIRHNSRENSSVYSEPATPERLNIPTLLIKGADDSTSPNNVDDEEEDIDQVNMKSTGNSGGGLLSMSDSHSTKEDNTSTIGDLPSPSRTKNHHLGVNMATYLGRRRHTIGQIGTTGIEPLEKAKNYNYIRKFSVDIQALQAQLENPKIHAEFPYRSDTELQKTGQNSNDTKILNSPQTQKKTTSPMQNATSNSTQLQDSNHDSKIDSESKDQTSNLQDSSYETLVPPLITLSETTADECHDTLNASNTDKSSSFIKLSSLLVTTFICCLLPMFITETVGKHLSRTAYINVLTCTSALSIIQTIIYPHIVFCMDAMVHVSIHRLGRSVHNRLMHLCYNRQEVPTFDQGEVTVTQV